MSGKYLTTWASVLLALLISFSAAATVRADSLTLAWDASAESQVLGYYVYIGTSSGTYTTVVDVGPATEYTFSDVGSGTTYYLTVAAYSAGPTVGVRAPELVTRTGSKPALLNPGNRTDSTNAAVSLALAVSNPDKGPLTFSATGLPPGLSLNVKTGTITGAPTTAGTFDVSVRVSDASANISTQTFIWTVMAVDAAAPTIFITNPMTSDGYSTSDGFVTISGTAADDVAVSSVTWTNSRGGSGTVAGTSNWSVVVPLQTGANTLTVTAIDTAKKSSSAVLTVTAANMPEALRVTAMSSDMAAPQPPGAVVRVTATVTGGRAPYQYKWWVFDGTWSVLSEWSAQESLAWKSGKANKEYRIGVWVRSADSSVDAPDNGPSSVSIPFPIDALIP